MKTYEICYHCKEAFDVVDMVELSSGEYVCEGCSFEHCSLCSMGECEVETWDGEYVCSDCYSGWCDDAYESSRD